MHWAPGVEGCSSAPLEATERSLTLATATEGRPFQSFGFLFISCVPFLLMTFSTCERLKMLNYAAKICLAHCLMTFDISVVVSVLVE